MSPKPSICILERSKGRWPGNLRYPDTLDGVTGEFRSPVNPLGLYELLNYRYISVVKGCGLGGSLINVYERARKVLGVGPDPRASTFLKVQAVDRRAHQLGAHAAPLDLAINFTASGVNKHGVPTRPCRACRDCTTGCDHLSKNTLYVNRLPMARKAGAETFTETEVEWIENAPDGGWRARGHYGEEGDSFTLRAANVILAAGSTEILMRSRSHGLSLSPALGTRFSCNGDFFGLAYNGGFRTQISGFGNHPVRRRAECSQRSLSRRARMARRAGASSGILCTTGTER